MPSIPESYFGTLELYKAGGPDFEAAMSELLHLILRENCTDLHCPKVLSAYHSYHGLTSISPNEVSRMIAASTRPANLVSASNRCTTTHYIQATAAVAGPSDGGDDENIKE